MTTIDLVLRKFCHWQFFLYLRVNNWQYGILFNHKNQPNEEFLLVLQFRGALITKSFDYAFLIFGVGNTFF